MESFFVEGAAAPLGQGERERAQAWEESRPRREIGTGSVELLPRQGAAPEPFSRRWGRSRRAG
jgi:hypothetical protein